PEHAVPVVRVRHVLRPRGRPQHRQAHRPRARTHPGRRGRPRGRDHRPGSPQRVSFRFLHHPAGPSAAVTGGIGPRPRAAGERGGAAAAPRHDRAARTATGLLPRALFPRMCAFGRDLDGSGRSVDGRGRPPVRAAGPTPGGGGGVSEPVIKIGAVCPGCVTTGGHQMIIDRRFHGPEGSGNGGYVAGRLAGRVPIDTVTVRLRQPPPLDTELTVTVEDERGHSVRLWHGDLLVAEALAGAIVVPPVAPVPFER